MPILSQTPPATKLKRHVVIYVIASILCTLILIVVIISAITNSRENTSLGHSASIIRTVGNAAGITAVSSDSSGYALSGGSYAQKGTVSESAAMADSVRNAPTAPSADPNTGTNGTAAQRIIRNGNLSLRVTDAPGSLEQAKNIAEARGGFVQSSSISDIGSGPRTGYITIRVPVDTFQLAIADLKKIAVVVLDESTDATDVTMQYVDLESNLRNARAEEQSYLDLLKRTGSMNDILSVTRALATVRGRIEQLDGQKRYMESQTENATIRVTLTEETRIEAPTRTWKPLEVVRSAFSELVISLQGLVDVLIRLVIGFIGLFIPIALIVAFFIWLGWKVISWIIKKIFLKNNGSTPDSRMPVKNIR